MKWKRAMNRLGYVSTYTHMVLHGIHGMFDMYDIVSVIRMLEYDSVCYVLDRLKSILI